MARNAIKASKHHFPDCPLTKSRVEQKYDTGCTESPGKPPAIFGSDSWAICPGQSQEWPFCWDFQERKIQLLINATAKVYLQVVSLISRASIMIAAFPASPLPCRKRPGAMKVTAILWSVSYYFWKSYYSERSLKLGGDKNSFLLQGLQIYLLVWLLSLTFLSFIFTVLLLRVC